MTICEKEINPFSPSPDKKAYTKCVYVCLFVYYKKYAMQRPQEKQKEKQKRRNAAPK